MITATHACATHLAYRMTCDQYVALRQRAAGRCERCGRGGRQLSIDHDHALGLSAVRGMVCPKCNSRLGRVDAGTIEADPLDTAFLLNAWHRRMPLEFYPDNRTPHRAVRVADELWEAAQAKAKRRRESVADVIRRALLAYTEGDDK